MPILTSFDFPVLLNLIPISSAHLKHLAVLFIAWNVEIGLSANNFRSLFIIYVVQSR